MAKLENSLQFCRVVTAGVIAGGNNGEGGAYPSLVPNGLMKRKPGFVLAEGRLGNLGLLLALALQSNPVSKTPSDAFPQRMAVASVSGLTTAATTSRPAAPGTNTV